MTFILTFTYCTLFMNPDLDLVHNIKVLSIRGILSLPFRFYSRIFKHRGISHSLIFGSLTRILWLGGIALVIYQALPSSRNMNYCHSYKYFIWYAAAGVCLADWGHLLLDIKQ